MSSLKPFDEIGEAELMEFERALSAFYVNPPPEYHSSSLTANSDWSAPGYEPHRRIVASAIPGTKVLDVGCGSAAAAVHFHAMGAVYTGLDVSEEQLRADRARYPWASFMRGGWEDLEGIGTEFDMVTSFFVLEHMTRPREFISACASRVRRGGLLAVLAPEYLQRGFMPSMHLFGKRPGGLRSKLSELDLIEAIRTALDRYVSFPSLIRRSRQVPGGAWLINLRPVCLDVRRWNIDWDAVYMVGEKEVVGYIERLGFKIQERGAELAGGGHGLCYVLARKL